MKKLIFICGAFGNGGAATVMKNLVKNIDSNIYNIEIIEFREDINSYKLPDNVEHTVLDKSKHLNILIKIKRIFKLRSILKKYDNVTIISFEYYVNLYTILSNLFLKNKLIISERNDPASVGNNKKNLRNFLYRFCNVLVCQTDDAKKYFPTYIQSKTVVIPNPISQNLPVRYEGKRKKYIVTFCRIEKQKNLPMLIDAFNIINKKYKEYKLLIYGDGSQKEILIDKINKMGLSQDVKLMPFTKDIHSKIYDASMYVSTSDYEGISNSMLESMAIGLPVVCTDCPCGGARMAIIDNYNGLLTKVGDYKEFAQKCIMLIENEKLSSKLSINATEVRSKFSLDKIITEWLNLV